MSKELDKDFGKWSAADKLYALSREEWPADRPRPNSDEYAELQRQAADETDQAFGVQDIDPLGVYTGNALGSPEPYAGQSAVPYDDLEESQARHLAVSRGLDYRGDLDQVIERLKDHDVRQQARAQQSSQQRPFEQTAKAGETDYARLTVDELRELLRTRSLDDRGKKDELVERLELDDRVNQPGTEPS